MIEFNGWVSILNTTDGEESSESLKETVKQVQLLLAPLKTSNQTFEIKEFNGSYIVWISGNHNHDNGYSEDIFQLLKQISHIAKGSYGIVYIRYPEDGLMYNEFRVYRIAKGKVTVEKDELLSPCNPTIEE